MSETRDFHISDILSITTGIAVSTTGKYPIDGVYGILNFMTGESLYTHQLPRVGREAQPVLLRQHPQLADVDASGVTPENCRTWVAEQAARYGEHLPVTAMSIDEHEHREAMSELAEIVPPDRIITVRS